MIAALHRSLPALIVFMLLAGCGVDGALLPRDDGSQPSARASAAPKPVATGSAASAATASPSAAATGRPTAGATPSASASPSASPSASSSPSPPPAPEPFAINLYREGAFVSEYTKYYCLPAAMQVMINIMSDGQPDTTRETQDRLYELADELDGVDLPRRVRDVEPEGWANGLNAEGYGPYVVHAEPTMEEAISVAARQLRLTGRPVGLLTWRGAHSWVMSGFESTADPMVHEEFAVTGVWIQDVWWPRISTRWGESDPPNTLVPLERLPKDYLKYRRPYGRFPDKDGQFVLVIPLQAEAR